MMFEKIQEAVNFILTQTKFKPEFGIVLGTGLGGLVDEIKIEKTIPYHAIPHFPEPTVQSHKGQLIFGHLNGKAIVAMAGRFHYYEGYSMKEVTFPIRVLNFLGIKRIIISNVSGSTNTNMEAGDIVFVKDHINLHAENPLRGINDERLGPRFPDMKEAYDESVNELAMTIAEKNNIRAHLGVYAGLQGPNLETPAEYNYIHKIGGDIVGMSTVPEVIVAKHMDLPVFVISVVSNKCFPINTIKKTTIESVIALAKKAEPKMSLIVKTLIETI